MSKPLNWFWFTCKTVVTVVLLLVVLCLAVLFFFGAPIAMLAETRDILAMDSQTPGVVTNVETARVTYQFVVNGDLIESRRIYPGFLGNHGTSEAQRRLADDFKIGQKCKVFYDSSSPQRCSLRYGWFQWSVGFAAGVWGMVFAGYFRSKESPFAIIASALLIYGAGLIFLGPSTVHVREIHWHVLAIICILIPVTIHYLYKRNASEQAHAPEPAAGSVSNGEPLPPPR